MEKKYFLKSVFILCLMALPLRTAADDLLRGDCNNDGVVNISDVTALINFLLYDSWPQESTHDNDWVDLGLPSGTLWATMNIGASCPDEYGYYFAWGETKQKGVYNMDTYKWFNGSSYTKYYINDDGTIGDMLELEPEDDAAYVNWGPLWRMPTLEQIEELCDMCTSTLTTRNGVSGVLLTGPNGNRLFFPFSGIHWDLSLDNVGLTASYWSRELCQYYNSYFGKYYSDYSYGIYATSGGSIDGSKESRYCGLTIRAVRVSQN